MFAAKQNAIIVCGEDRCIRTCSLDDDDATEWTLHSQIDEESLPDTIVNFPICSSLSPDGSMIAFGYRNHPLTVWELKPPMLLGQCYVRLDEYAKTVHKQAWGGVFRVEWHPLSGEVFGLTQVGLLFRWDPHQEETSVKVKTGGHSMAINQDGSLVATGDGVGTIKVFATADFSKLYQLSSLGHVPQLSFSTDSRRLYDVRVSYGNVWEPSTLVHLADSLDHGSDAKRKMESLAKGPLLSEHRLARVDSVISLAGQPSGLLYCYGTINGVATLCEAGRGKVCELARFASYMPIEHITWSRDGKLVALADLSGKLVIKSVSRSGDSWEASHKFDVRISPENDNIISQLMFHPTDNKLLVATPVKVISIDVECQAMAESVLDLRSTDELELKWTWHPTSPDTVIGFGSTQVHVIRWTDLRQTKVYDYSSPLVERPSAITVPSVTKFEFTGSFQGHKTRLRRLVTNADASEVLLGIWSNTGPSGQFQSEYLLFDVGTMHMGEAGDGAPKMLPCTVVAPEISSRIRKPLTILPRRRLVFLDVDRWVCTWRLPPSTGGEAYVAQGRSAAEPSGATGIEQHYFLPADWVTPSNTELCTVTAHGTLLCPRDGDVVAVQAARLRK
jgi:WD40 repeat protein